MFSYTMKRWKNVPNQVTRDMIIVSSCYYTRLTRKVVEGEGGASNKISYKSRILTIPVIDEQTFSYLLVQQQLWNKI